MVSPGWRIVQQAAQVGPGGKREKCSVRAIAVCTPAALRAHSRRVPQSFGIVKRLSGIRCERWAEEGIGEESQ